MAKKQELVGYLCECGRANRSARRPCNKCHYDRYGERTKARMRERYKNDQTHRAHVIAAIRKRAKTTGNYKIWISRLICALRRLTKRRAASGRTGMTFSVTTKYLQTMWLNQNGLCALTGISMTCEPRSPFAMSVDRIDSLKGYCDGNVQLICRAINYAKSDFTQQQMVDFIVAIRSTKPSKEKRNGSRNRNGRR